MVSEAPKTSLWTLDATGGLRPLREAWLTAALTDLLPAGSCQVAVRSALAGLGRRYPSGGFVDPGELQDHLWLDRPVRAKRLRCTAVTGPLIRWTVGVFWGYWSSVASGWRGWTPTAFVTKRRIAWYPGWGR